MNAIKIVESQDFSNKMDSIKRLVADKLENKRLAALDMMQKLHKAEEINGNYIKELIQMMPKITDREKVLVDQLASDNKEEFNAANGFGLYDTQYRPRLPLPNNDEQFNLDDFNHINVDEIIDLYKSLIKLIEENKDYKYNIRNWDNSEIEVVLGSGHTLNPLYDNSDKEKKQHYLSDYPLSDVWRKWAKDNDFNAKKYIQISFMKYLRNYQYEYKRNYNEFGMATIEKLFPPDPFLNLMAYSKSVKDNYGILAEAIMTICSKEIEKETLFDYAIGVLCDLVKKVPPDDFKNDIEDERHRTSYYRSNKEFDKLYEANEIWFFVNMLNRAWLDDKRFVDRLAVDFKIAESAGRYYLNFDIKEIARAVTMGAIEIPVLYRAYMVSQNAAKNISRYLSHLNEVVKKELEQYPVLKETLDRVVARILEIEVKRGDTPTAVSDLAKAIHKHEGIENFVNILIALGNETLERGYSYSSDKTKRSVLSSLLQASMPAKNDTADKLRKYIGGRISDKRLLEATMYSPDWTDLVSDYLGWKGFKSAIWYFHAHTNQGFSASKETEVAKFSPVTPQEFVDGAFDIDWFISAYKTLGKERFNILYDCAKYLSDGSAHRRAQLYADAALGKLKVTEIEKEIKDKRNKDKLMSYSLIPLKGDKMKAALRRYEFIQKFLKESKQFGQQRKESEAKASKIALENLSRNFGFNDTLRFSWKMETFKMEQLKQYFEPKDIEGNSVNLSIDENGKANIIVISKEKQLKSIPTKIAKNKYIVEIKEIKNSLKEQFTRAKKSLEFAMENRDKFPRAELADLLKHPVIAPLIKKLVYKAGDSLGFFHEDGLTNENGELIYLSGNDELIIAHPYDLFITGVWSGFQKYAFENALIQPFKQIFRELYVLNEDEKKEKTLSRRYAGHQVQPRKTVELLKGRNWTVDYNNGLQKVYYKENVIATMYAMADWFSPADIEAPTLETVRFYDRNTGEHKNLAEVDPLIFSEIMRDIDLVVSVAHVGGVDPEASHSTIEMRAAIIGEAIKMLHINNVEISGSHAKIRGAIGEYDVHLGSGMIHMQAKGAINVLPVHSQHRGRIFLPFVDEDPKTAEITTKILLFADDLKIKDPTILSQIK